MELVTRKGIFHVIEVAVDNTEALVTAVETLDIVGAI